MSIRLIAAYADVKLVEPAFDFGKEGSDNKAPAFLRNAHPLGKVPVLETKDGCIFESMAIARHIARLGSDKGLYGATPFEVSQVDQWIEFASQELSPSVTGWLGRLMGKLPKNKELTEKAISYIKECFTPCTGHVPSPNRSRCVAGSPRRQGC
ncbi:putative elongation factor 1-gamma 1 [Diplonema papillatum]|nr:putative elongation factor 1-gamma 1 [Diplonema papillatum]